METQCSECGQTVECASTGRPRRFCSNACRQKSYRDRKVSVPAKMRGRRAWVRADGKRPIQPSGVAASSTDTRTWHTWDAVQHGAGDGFGVMLGDGLACYDLDRVSDSDARRFISTLAEPIVLVERSISGKGVHVFLEAPESKGWKRVIDGLSVEFYSRARFIRMTGVPFKV